MLFEWFVFFFIFALFFALEGNNRQSFAMSFVGAVLLMILGATLNIDGLATENATIQDLNSTARNINFYQKNYEDVFTYGVGLLIMFLGIGTALYAVSRLYYLRKQQSGW